MKLQPTLIQICLPCALVALLLSSAAVQGQSTSFSVTIPAQSWYEDYIAVPNDASSLAISLENVTGSGPVGIFLTNMDGIGFNDYGVEPISPPGGYLVYGLTNNPPLAGGTWYNGIYNYNATIPVTLNVQIAVNVGVETNVVQNDTNNAAVPLAANGTVNTSQLCISNGQQIMDVSVGVRLTNSNLDDLELELTSPQGSNIVLFEDLGGALANNLGVTLTTFPSTNYIYTTFTEDANLNPVPIASGVSPYAGSNTSGTISVFSNGFEGVAVGTYSNGQSVAGWMVGANQVSVVTEGSVAHKGSNYLALANGRISQTFATVPGTTYQLVYYARSPGLTDWWPADKSAVDLVGTNAGTITDTTFDVGEVNQAFGFNGSDSQVTFGTSAGNFGTNDFSLDFWIRTTQTADLIDVLAKRPVCSWDESLFDILIMYDVQGTWGSATNIPTLPGRILYEHASGNSQDGLIVAGVTDIADGNYHHLAITRHGPAVLLYVDGKSEGIDGWTPTSVANISNNSPFTAGQDVCQGGDTMVPFSGDLDELDIWNRALSAAEVNAITKAASSGKYSPNDVLYPNFQVGIGGIGTNTVIISNFSGGWQACTESFVATSTQTTLELAGNTLGVLLDDVQLQEQAYTNDANYYLPEQPLTPLFGQNPQGCWTLSIWDTRQNAALPANGALLGWTLQLTTASTNLAVIAPTTITAQPQNVTMPTNTNATFAVTASGTAPLSYQWCFSNTNLQKAAGAVAQMLDGFVYGATVTNAGSGYTTVPRVQFIGGGGSGTLAAATVSNGMVIAVNVTNAGTGYTSLPTVVIDPPSGVLAGQTNPILNVNAITANSAGNYFVLISNIYGTMTSSLAALTLAYPPSITRQPSNQTAAYGYGATFNVTAAGTQPFGYQWWTAATHQTNAAATPMVINGFVLGATVTQIGSGYLSVPSVQIVGGSGSGAAGYAQVGHQAVTNVQITSAGSGYATPPTIQIGAPAALMLSGQNNPSLVVTAGSNGNAENYYVVVTNNYGSVTSAMAGLTVFLAPQNFAAIGTNNNQVALELTGTPNFSYILQSATNLTPPVSWQPVLTNPADTNGNWSTTVSNSPGIPSQFFRALGQ